MASRSEERVPTGRIDAANWSFSRIPMPWQVFCLLTVILLLCYASVVCTTYGFSDDYTELLAHVTGSEYPWAFRIESGRPANAIFNALYFLMVSNIDGLRYLRLLAVIQISIVAWGIYLTLRYVGWEWWQAICASLIVATLPPFQVYVSYVLTASYPISILFAGAAFYFAEISIAERFQRKILPLAAILLLSIAVLNYQPVAMFFWVFAAIVMFAPDATMRRIIQRLLWYFAIFVPATGIGMYAYVLGKRLYGTGLIGRDRAAIGHDYLAKAHWFLRAPLKDALNLVNIFPSTSVAVLLLGFITIGLLLYFRGNISERLAKIAIAGALVALSYMPNLVVAESFSSYQTQGALTSLIAIYIFLSIKGFASWIPRKYRLATTNPIMTTAAAICLVMASYHVQIYFTLPQSVELQVMRQRIAQQDLAYKQAIYVMGANMHSFSAPPNRYDEFGVASSARPWAAGPEAALLLRSMGISRTHLPIRVILQEPLGRPPLAQWLREQAIYVSPPESENPPTNVAVVDMRNLDRLP